MVSSPPRAAKIQVSVVQLHYNFGMAVDWSKRGEYIAKRGMTRAIANEALADPDALVQVPDPAS